MDESKARAFRDTLTEYRELLLENRKLDAQEKFDILAKMEDTWYEPVCFTYNLLAPLDYPIYAKDRWTQVKEMPEGRVFLFVTLGYGQWLLRENLLAAMANVEDG